jgi:cysteine desulfurase
VAYLDAASAEPLHPAAREVFLAALDAGWADPARLYGEARRVRMLLDTARETVAGVLGARADEVSFTANGTQAAHLAVLGGLSGRRRAGQRLVTSAVEHSAVLQAGRRHEAAGGRVTIVPVDAFGRVDLDAFASAARGGDVALASLQSANHEVGTVQPVAAAAAACAEAGVPLHVDAAQSVGRSELPAGWSLLSASAHKWGGPPGVGVLVVRRSARWRSPLPDDEREGGRVPGAENVPAILAAATALEAVERTRAQDGPRLHALIDRLRGQVSSRVPDVAVLGDPDDRLPHLVTFSCLYVDGEALLGALDAAGYAVSSGSSCTSSALRPSHVLEAMGALSHGNVRVSLPRASTREDVDGFLDALAAAVARLRAADPAHPATPDTVLTVDARGRRCPIPVIELARHIEAIPVGASLAVLADDEAAALDVPAWCRMRDHEFIGAHPVDGGTAYVVRRAPAASSNAAGSGSSSAARNIRR